MDQARRDRDLARQVAGGGTGTADASGNSSAQAQEMDNASFLVSLSPELRAEVLLTADPAFIASLPPELVAEAQMHRERAAAQWQQREVQAAAHGHAAIARSTAQVRHTSYHTPYRHNLSIHPIARPITHPTNPPSHPSLNTPYPLSQHTVPTLSPPPSHPSHDSSQGGVRHGPGGMGHHRAGGPGYPGGGPDGDEDDDDDEDEEDDDDYYVQVTLYPFSYLPSPYPLLSIYSLNSPPLALSPPLPFSSPSSTPLLLPFPCDMQEHERSYRHHGGMGSIQRGHPRSHSHPSDPNTRIVSPSEVTPSACQHISTLLPIYMFFLTYICTISYLLMYPRLPTYIPRLPTLQRPHEHEGDPPAAYRRLGALPRPRPTPARPRKTHTEHQR